MATVIFLIILLIIFICWPWISKWFSKFMARRAENLIRRMMGMPTRKEEERARKNEERAQRKQKSGSSRRNRRDEGNHYARSQAADLMKSVAEDAEFVEIKEYSSTTVFEQDKMGKQTRIYREEQVTDAEYTEIRDTKRRS